jgi:hypothetical protein
LSGIWPFWFTEIAHVVDFDLAGEIALECAY